MCDSKCVKTKSDSDSFRTTNKYLTKLNYNKHNTDHCTTVLYYNHPGDHSGLGGARMGLNDSVNLG